MAQAQPTAEPPGGSTDYRPVPVKLSLRDIGQQTWLDVFGKETASAATYSYLWLADQMGHIGLGLLLGIIICAIGESVGLAGWITALIAILGTSAIFSFWEWRAYQTTVEGVKGFFPVDRVLTARNAIAATVYMILGSVFATGVILAPDWWKLVVVLVCLVVGIVVAPFWLRQKIVWQRVGLPYLARLWGIGVTLGDDGKLPAVAERLTKLIDAAVGADAPQHVVIWGPPGSGKTTIASAIGTELAFRGRKVRYLTFDKFAQLAFAGLDDSGPANIGYWPWSGCEVLMLDDIDPGLADRTYLSQEEFKYILTEDLIDRRAVLTDRTVVWLLGAHGEDARGYIAAIEEVTGRPVVEVPLAPWAG